LISIKVLLFKFKKVLIRFQDSEIIINFKFQCEMTINDTKRIFFPFVLLFQVLTISAIGLSQKKQENYETVRVASFQGDRVAALTYTFDDGLQDQYTLAAPMLEKFGFRGTFFVIPSLIPDTKAQADAKKSGVWGGIAWPQLKELSLRGHEIGNHGWSHRSLKELNDTIIVKEIDNAWQRIKDKIGVSPMTFCYPYNAFDDRIRKFALHNHICTRDSARGIGKNISLESFNAQADAAIRKKSWEVFMIHGIANGFDAFTDPKVLENHLSYVKLHDDKIWVSPFANVVRYIRERNSVNLKIKQKHNQIICTMESPLDPLIYNYPLTVVFEVKGAKIVNAKYLGKKMPVVIYPDRFCVDWAPGSKPVKITWK